MSDWETFIKSIGELFGRDLDDCDVTAQYAGKRVVSTGKLAEKRFRPDRAGVQMDMPAVRIDLPDGRYAKVDYLFLKLRNEDVQSWRMIPEGKTLRFETQIAQMIGPLPAIRWLDASDGKGIIMFSTDGAVPL